MSRHVVIPLVLGIAILASACAPAVRTEPATFQAATAARPGLRVTTAVPIHLDTGYKRVVKEGSVWRYAGKVAQGAVYAPVDTVFSIRGSQMHEAWLVIRDGALQGFYLPGESMYSPLSTAVPIPSGEYQ